MWFIVIVMGLAAGLWDDDWPPTQALFFLLLLAVLLLKKHRVSQAGTGADAPVARQPFQPALMMGLMILAYLYSNVYLAVLFQPIFPAHLAAETLLVQGEVLAVEKQQTAQGYQQIRLQVDSCQRPYPVSGAGRPCEFSGVVLLNRYPAADDALPTELAVPGEYWRFAVRLYPLRGFVNPGQGRYRLQQLARGLDGRGYVRHEPLSQRLAEAYGYQPLLNRWRQGFLQRAEQGEGALVTTLLSGDSRYLASNHWSLLQATGTLHLVVVSGLHLGVLLAGGWLLCRLLPKVLPLDRRWQRVAVLLLPFMLLFPMLLIWPAGVAVLRAFLMALLLVLLRAAGVALKPWRILQLAVLVLLLFQPLYLLRPGFYYSVAAVALLLLTVSAGRGAGLFFKIQLVLLLGLLPLQGFWLNSPDLISGLANLVAIPLVSVLILPLALLLMLWPLPFLQNLLLQLEQLFWQWLALCLQFELGIWQPGVIAGLVLMLAALVLTQSSLPGRAPAFVLALILLWNGLRDPAAGQEADFRVQVFEVGQGLAVGVQVGPRYLVYDTGPGFRSGFMPVSAVLPPLLRASGHRIDRLIVSHQDNDHAGGVPALLPLLADAGDILAGQPQQLAQQLLQTAAGSRVTPRGCYAGQHWRWADVAFQVLYPPQPGTPGAPVPQRSDNDFSCVLHIRSLTDPGQSLLLTGDIDQRAERWLLQSGQPLQARWLVASHHGSAGGNSLAFLAAVQPRGIIYSAGFQNSYGHPARQVQRRVAYLRSLHPGAFRQYNTAELGALTLFGRTSAPCSAAGPACTSPDDDYSMPESARERLPLRWRWQAF